MCEKLPTYWRKLLVRNTNDSTNLSMLPIGLSTIRDYSTAGREALNLGDPLPSPKRYDNITNFAFRAKKPRNLDDSSASSTTEVSDVCLHS
jgi:hypothetical protein